MNFISKIIFSLKNNKASIIVTFIFLAYTLCSFGFYWARTLNGDINNHMLIGEMFGVPQALKEKGIVPLYYGPGQTGWDGQFYYYMSNDLLAEKDTPNHIDAPSYRYQRIGLSLYVATIAKIFNMGWVSPALFFWSYLSLILLATFVGAQLFKKLKVQPVLILLWSLSVGTQITLFNALPDAAADSFLILALAALFKRRYTLATLPFIFSALSREVYTLFPSVILFCLFLNLIFNSSNSGKMGLHQITQVLFKWHSFYLLALPGLIAVIWHIYITHHFGVAPSEQAPPVIGFPLFSWWEYFISGVRGHHKFVALSFPSYVEAFSLLLFLSVLISALCVSIIAIKNRSKITPELQGLALITVCLVCIYASFGPIVIKYYTGYMKALALFSFLLPLFASMLPISRQRKLWLYMLLIGSISFTTVYNMSTKIMVYEPHLDQYTHLSSVSESKNIACLGIYHAKVQIDHIKIIKSQFLQNIFGQKDLLIVELSLTNTGQYTFISTQNLGSVYMSYQWVDSNDKLIVDSFRSALPSALLPGNTVKISVVSYIPEDSSELYFKPSLVQEGCA